LVALSATSCARRVEAASNVIARKVWNVFMSGFGLALTASRLYSAAGGGVWVSAKR
jgi:hypothetical protein